MRKRTWAALIAMALGGSATAATDGGRQVALVVGVGSYGKLPADIRLSSPANEATAVAAALRAAGFQDVVLLRDGEAGKGTIEAMIRDRLAPTLTAGDILVVYFAGHGVGADLGVPTLLAYDSTIENGEKDGLELNTFAADLRAWSHAGTNLIVTDAIHSQQTSGVSLYGPAATQWPPMPPGFVVVSSSPAGVPAKDGGFGSAFIDAVQKGDRSRDGVVSAAELLVSLGDSLAASGQTPVINPGYNPNIVVFRGNAPVVASVPDAPPPPQYPDKDVPAAKFVWMEGESQIVSCRNVEPVECLGSCYVRSFKAGPCGLQMLAGGETVKGEVVVTEPGRYDCARSMVGLSCKKVQ